MSRSVFYAVRFSPAPELGEWLNIAVVGEGLSEPNAGIAVTESLARIEAAFGKDAAERVQHICEDLSHVIGEMLKAQERGEETQPITMSLKDMALSVGFSDKIVVFETEFHEALAQVADKYLSGAEEIAANLQQSLKQTKATEAGIGIFGAIQKFLTPPPVVGKAAGQEERSQAVSPTHDKTVLLIGDSGEIEAALIADMLEKGHTVRVCDVSEGAGQIVEVVKKGPSAKDVASHTGIDVPMVKEILQGNPAIARLSKVTIDTVKEAAEKLGVLGGTKGHFAGYDVVASNLDGVDAVVLVADSPHGALPTAEANAIRLGIVREAKAKGARQAVLASSYRVYGKSSQPLKEGAPLRPNSRSGESAAQLESELLVMSEDGFVITILRLGELYGHAKDSATTSKVASGDRHAQTVNGIVAKAVYEGRVAVNDTPPIPFLHVEDAAEAVSAILGAPAEAVAGQIFNVGDESQHRTFAEVAERVRSQVPDAEVIVAAADLESGACLMAFAKFASELGFTPQRTVEEGIEHIASALKAAKAATPPPPPKPSGSDVEQPELNIDWERLAKSKVEAPDPTQTEEIRKQRP